MKIKGSILADEIVQEWNREHYFKKLVENKNKIKYEGKKYEGCNKQYRSD